MSDVLDGLYEGSAGGEKPVFSDPQFEEQCPDVYLWMSKDEYRDQPRRLPSITLFVEEGRLKCCLNDRATDQIGFWTFKNAFGLWKELQEAFASCNVDWRPSRATQASRGKK